MPFYSLALNYNSSWKSENAGPHRIRFLVITPDRGTADLLFRVIQDNPRDLTERVSFDEIRRLSPQMWSWSATGHDDHTGLQQTIVDINRGNVRHKDNKSKEHLEKLRGKVTFQYVGDWTENFFVIPHLDVPDHISGQTFCIRSQRVPSQFWHYPHANAHETKNVTLSTTERAIFKIQAEGARDKETLMVDTDKVQLELVVVDDTQSYPSSLHSEEIQGYNDAPVFNARRCPRFEYFDCKECVPLRNGDNGQPCACDGWVYDDFTKECRPSSITPPPSNCEADLQQCRNEMHRVEQELQNCRQNCGQKPSQPPPQKPGKFEYDSNGDYRCKFVPSNGGGYPGRPCKGPLKPEFQYYPQGITFYNYKSRGNQYFPAQLPPINGPAVLEISDQYCRVSQYEVRIKGQSLGWTSNTQFDRRCHVFYNSYCRYNMDDCIRKGFSHGFFQIPSGSHNVQIVWVNGDFQGWTHNEGLYRVYEPCPGQY